MLGFPFRQRNHYGVHAHIAETIDDNGIPVPQVMPIRPDTKSWAGIADGVMGGGDLYFRVRPASLPYGISQTFDELDQQGGGEWREEIAVLIVDGPYLTPASGENCLDGRMVFGNQGPKALAEFLEFAVHVMVDGYFAVTLIQGLRSQLLRRQ